MKQPHQQGVLDGLCSIYSIINSLRLVVGNISVNQCKYLLIESIKAIEEKKASSDFIVDGIGINDLAYIMRCVIEKEYPMVKRSKPFHKNSDATIDDFWERTEDFLLVPKRAAIVGLATAEIGHWSVIRSISAKRLYLFDSSGLHFLNKSNCTTEKLVPTLTYYLELKE